MDSHYADMLLTFLKIITINPYYYRDTAFPLEELEKLRFLENYLLEKNDLDNFLFVHFMRLF